MVTQEEYDAATKLAASGENTGIMAVPQDKQLKLYGWFKQVKEGDNTTAAPGMMSMPGSKVKWEAWEACKGMSKEAAMKVFTANVTLHIAARERCSLVDVHRVGDCDRHSRRLHAVHAGQPEVRSSKRDWQPCL